MGKPIVYGSGILIDRKRYLDTIHQIYLSVDWLNFLLCRYLKGKTLTVRADYHVFKYSLSISNSIEKQRE